MEQLPNDTEPKPWMEFEGLPGKKWGANKTNTGILCDAFDRDDIDNWVGHKITLSKGKGRHKDGTNGDVVIMTIPPQDEEPPI